MYQKLSASRNCSTDKSLDHKGRSLSLQKGQCWYTFLGNSPDNLRWYLLHMACETLGHWVTIQPYCLHVSWKRTISLTTSHFFILLFLKDTEVCYDIVWVTGFNHHSESCIYWSYFPISYGDILFWYIVWHVVWQQNRIPGTRTVRDMCLP